VFKGRIMKISHTTNSVLRGEIAKEKIHFLSDLDKRKYVDKCGI
jgi:hypothetical protein